MITRIDWISFSFEVKPRQGNDELGAIHNAIDGIRKLHPSLPEFLSMGDGFEAGKGRAPYSIGWTHASGGYRLFTNSATPHALIEISGKGCDNLSEPQALHDLLKAVHKRITRLDIAQDILCNTDPREFSAQRSNQRFKSHSQVVSDHGITSYVGSRTSNRYVRVYRYKNPHPRSAFMRIEYSVKAEDAKATAAYIIENGIEATGKALGDAFGWKHPVYRPDATEAQELAVWRPERRQGNTVYWLNDTVGPLVARLHNEGLIDVYEWLQSAVIPRIITDDTE